MLNSIIVFRTWMQHAGMWGSSGSISYREKGIWEQFHSQHCLLLSLMTSSGQSDYWGGWAEFRQLAGIMEHETMERSSQTPLSEVQVRNWFCPLKCFITNLSMINNTIYFGGKTEDMKVVLKTFYDIKTSQFSYKLNAKPLSKQLQTENVCFGVTSWHFTVNIWVLRGAEIFHYFFCIYAFIHYYYIVYLIIKAFRMAVSTTSQQYKTGFSICVQRSPFWLWSVTHTEGKAVILVLHQPWEHSCVVKVIKQQKAILEGGELQCWKRTGQGWSG